MILEFIGVPGSGKSHISNDLAKELKKRNFNVLTNEKLIQIYKKRNLIINIMNILPCLFKVDFYLIVILIMKDKRPLKSKYILFKLLIRRILVYQIINKDNRRDNIYLLDEGLLHFGVALFRNRKKINERDIIKYINNIQNIKKYKRNEYLYVFIEGDIETNFNRIESRESNWPIKRDSLNLEEKLFFLKSSFHSYNKFLKTIEEINKVVINNKNNDTNFLKDFNQIIEIVNQKEIYIKHKRNNNRV